MPFALIKYREDSEIDYIRLIDMISQCGRDDMSTDYKELYKTVNNSMRVVTAWDFDYMIGFANKVKTPACGEEVKYILVDREYSGQGIEEKLEDMLTIG